MDLSTKYLCFKLRNPLIAGSSGLTADPRKIRELEENGAGAIMLKSIFEEEIALEYDRVLEEITEEGFSCQSYDYYDYDIRANRLGEYTKLILKCGKQLSIQVIASVNSSYSREWVSFARELEKSCADALELNMFFLPSDLTRSREEQERVYFKVVKKIVKAVDIPVALKISYHFSNLRAMIKQISGMGVAGLVLFNRFFRLDFDIEKLKVVPAHTSALSPTPPFLSGGSRSWQTESGANSPPPEESTTGRSSRKCFSREPRPSRWRPPCTGTGWGTSRTCSGSSKSGWGDAAAGASTRSGER